VNRVSADLESIVTLHRPRQPLLEAEKRPNQLCLVVLVGTLRIVYGESFGRFLGTSVPRRDMKNESAIEKKKQFIGLERM
jgi:hypothetical protein